MDEKMFYCRLSPIVARAKCDVALHRYWSLKRRDVINITITETQTRTPHLLVMVGARVALVHLESSVRF